MGVSRPRTILNMGVDPQITVMAFWSRLGMKKTTTDALNNQQTLSRLELPECIYKFLVVVCFSFFCFCLLLLFFNEVLNV
jgi:hypothetical protein